MRVLFAANPEKTIFQYLVPLAWALRTAGHEVRFASQPAFAGEITQAGLTAVPVGSNRNPWRLSENKPEVRARMRVGIAKPYDVAEFPEKATWPYLTEGYAEATKWWHRLSNFPIIADLVDFARHWQPDLIIWEPITYAGPIAAKACGAAHARLLFGIDVFGITRDHYLRLKAQQPPAERTDPLAEWLASYGTKYNYEFTEDMTTGQFTIDQLPRSLQLEANLHYLRMQYVPYGGPAVIPHWLWQPPTRPRVALTMGLSATEIFDGYTIPLPDILDALADLDIELVATIAETEQRKLTRIPDNTRLVPYVPLHALVPTCAAVIHHAGAATLATTALHPIPQLALHYHYDQPILGRALAATGAALAIHTSQATGHTIRQSLLRLLHEPTFRHHATQLTNDIRALPTPNQLIPHLEELTAKHRSTAP
jgi:glycosyltransferase (activator-dependent family)